MNSKFSIYNLYIIATVAEWSFLAQIKGSEYMYYSNYL